MDENIIIPIQLNTEPALQKARNFGVSVTNAFKSIQGFKNGKVELFLNMQVGNGVTSFHNLGKTVSSANDAFKKLRPGAAQAENALLNLNRVVQDSPYGFIGISNNISPLLESFQRLKKETGSSKAALSALITGLTGAGGVGLAIAAVTAAVSFATIGFDMWTRRKQATKVATDELADREKAFNEIVKQSNQRAGDQIGTLITLNQTLTNTSASAENKRKAYDKILAIYPSYKAELDEDYKKNGNIATVITTRLIPAIVAAGKARAYQEKINKLAADNLDLENRKIKENNELHKKGIELNKAWDRSNRDVSTPAFGNAGTGASIGIGTATQSMYAENEYKAAGQAVKKTQDLINANTKAMDAYAASAVALIPKMDKLATSGEDAGKGTNSAATGLSNAAQQSKAFTNAQQELSDQIQYIDASFKNGFLNTLEHAKEKYKLLSDASKEFKVRFNEGSDSKLIRNIDAQLQQLRHTIRSIEVSELTSAALPRLKQISKDINVEIKPIPFINEKVVDTELQDLRERVLERGIKNIFQDGVLVRVEIATDKDAMNRSVSEFDGVIANYSSALQRVAQDGISELATGLGDTIAGVETLGGVFNRVGSVIGNAMAAFGKKMISAGVAMLSAKKTLPALYSNPAFLIAGGFALTAAGSAISSSLQRSSNQRLTGFAYGGGVSSPGLAVVGEHPSTSKNNPEMWGRFDQFKGLFGSMINDYARKSSVNVSQPGWNNGGGYPDKIIMEVSGDNLVGVIERTRNRQKRNYG